MPLDAVLGDGADPGLEIGRGGLVGEFGLLERRTRTATVRAVRDTTLARLSATDFTTLATDFAPLAMGLLRRILDRRGTVGSAPGAPCPIGRRARAAGDGPPSGTIGLGRGDRVRDRVGRVRTDARVCAADDVDRALSHPGIADTPHGAFGEVRLGELLHHLESDFDHIVYDAGDPRSAWAQRIVKSADLIVAVIDPEPSPAARTGIEQTFGAAPGDVPRWLAVVHPPATTRPQSGARLRTELAADEVHHVRGGARRWRPTSPASVASPEDAEWRSCSAVVALGATPTSAWCAP